jgi:hypothetical protein
MNHRRTQYIRFTMAFEDIVSGWPAFHMIEKIMRANGLAGRELSLRWHEERWEGIVAAFEALPR